MPGEFAKGGSKFIRSTPGPEVAAACDRVRPPQALKWLQKPGCKGCVSALHHITTESTLKRNFTECQLDFLWSLNQNGLYAGRCVQSRFRRLPGLLQTSCPCPSWPQLGCDGINLPEAMRLLGGDFGCLTAVPSSLVDHFRKALNGVLQDTGWPSKEWVLQWF